jgi:hypothetical protein
VLIYFIDCGSWKNICMSTQEKMSVKRMEICNMQWRCVIYRYMDV